MVEHQEHVALSSSLVTSSTKERKHRLASPWAANDQMLSFRR
jgi:hypothetical protein